MREWHQITVCLLVALLLCGCSREVVSPVNDEGVPTGRLAITGKLSINARALSGVPVSCRFSWKPGASGSKEISMLTDASGLYAFRELPSQSCEITWIYEVGSRKIEQTQSVVPPSEYSVDLTATASITGVLVSATNSIISPRRIVLVRVRPDVATIRNDSKVGKRELALDFRVEDCDVASAGAFEFRELPSGTYAILAPGRTGRGPNEVALFTPVVISLRTGETRTVQIQCL